ncbi:MAG: DUF6273 domain-containing protein [Lachnospiraceae bacterium]|nr:DUF6273 domain-containing protein [Lachnospiraceae bacterium]
MKKILSVLFIIMAFYIMKDVPVNVQAATKAKVVFEFTDGTKKSWETGRPKIELGKKLAYVYFGSYPQTEIKGKKLTSAIKNAKYNKYGEATVNGVKYKRISKEDAAAVVYSWDPFENPDNPEVNYDWENKKYAYFKFEPIKWKVLSNSKGKVFLFSACGLDAQQYNNEFAKITWEYSPIRKWISTSFINNAFNSFERKLIKTAKLVNADSKYYDTEGGNDTKDKVFLLSHDDVLNPKYGFSEDAWKEDIKRQCTITDYAKAMGVYTFNDGHGFYWLRSPECGANAISIYSGNGHVGNGGSRDVGYLNFDAVCPALYLNLSSIVK